MPRAYEQGWLKAYVQHQRYSESPLAFHFWTGVATIAGALRRKVWIDQLHFQWTPNFYIMLVGPPGVAAKSTSLRAGLSLLEQIDGVVFGPQSMTWQALLDAFRAAQESVTIPSTGQEVTMSCLTIGASELGTFLRPENREFLDLLTAMWDGQKEVFRRRIRTEETVITNPWINVIGCTTPSWLKDNFPEVLIGGGLTSRIVFVFAQKKRQLIAYPAREIPNASYLDEEKALVYDLNQIANLKGEYALTDDAYSWGETWYDHLNNGPRPQHMASDKFQGYIARKQTHVHKLAMVLAASKRDNLIITTEDLIEADEHTTVLERDMLHVFASIGVAPGAKVTSEVLKIIKNYGVISYRDLWRECINTIDPKEFQSAIESASEAGFIQKQGPIVKDGKKDWNLSYVGGIE